MRSLSKILIQQNTSPELNSNRRSDLSSHLPADQFATIEEKSDEEQQELREIDDFFNR
jgi:hypothetical protein